MFHLPAEALAPIPPVMILSRLVSFRNITKRLIIRARPLQRMPIMTWTPTNLNIDASEIIIKDYLNTSFDLHCIRKSILMLTTKKKI